jgi:hypothetical protein
LLWKREWERGESTRLGGLKRVMLSLAEGSPLGAARGAEEGMVVVMVEGGRGRGRREEEGRARRKEGREKKKGENEGRAENDIGRDQRWSSTTIRAGITVTYGTGHTAYLWVWTAAR